MATNKFFESKDFANGQFRPLMPEIYPASYRRYIAQEAQLLAAKVKGAGRVLDAGVGTGRLISIIAPLVDRLVGVDSANFMLEKSRQVASQFQNVSIVSGKLEELGRLFPKNHFDYSLCTWNTLGNVEDEVAILKELSRVASKGVILTVFLKGTIDERVGWYESVGIQLSKIDRENEIFYTDSGLMSRAYSPQDMEKLARLAGLRVTESKILAEVVLWTEMAKN